MIKYCGCKSRFAPKPARSNLPVTPCGGSKAAEFQDEKYGTGFRVHNRKPQTSSQGVSFICTVCSNVK